MSEELHDLALAVDIGGGSVKLALTSAAASDFHTGIVHGVSDLDAAALLDEISRSAETLLRLHPTHAGRLAGMAVGVPGHVSPDRRRSLNSNVPAIDGIDLVGFFEQRLGCPVHLENDANLAALGEWSFGPSSAATRFMMVTLGTGIGVALLDRGMPVDVVGGTLGDAGHVIVDPAAGRACRLGCKGCLEFVASGLALVEAAEELAVRLPRSALGALHRGGQSIEGSDLARLAAAGDDITLSLLARFARWLGMGLATYSNVFAPDVICVGGGLSPLGPYIEKALVETVHTGRIKNRAGPETIYFSSADAHAAARGAAILVFGKRSRAHG